MVSSSILLALVVVALVFMVQGMSVYWSLSLVAVGVVWGMAGWHQSLGGVPVLTFRPMTTADALFSLLPLVGAYEAGWLFGGRAVSFRQAVLLFALYLLCLGVFDWLEPVPRAIVDAADPLFHLATVGLLPLGLFMLLKRPMSRYLTRSPQ
jgi:hypothetical protein